jgi:hemolysin activation/secretion protein
LNTIYHPPNPPLELPEYQDNAPLPDDILPVLPASPFGEDGYVPDLSSAPRVFVRHIKLVGNTIFSEADLKFLLKNYENRYLLFAELQELRHKLTRYYVNKGYLNSGAVIPDQKVTDGVVEFHVIEGCLTTINITGNTRLNSDYIRKRIRLGADPPFNINHLKQQFSLLHQNRLIRRINGEFGPDLHLGEGRLNVKVEEASPYELGMKYSNSESPSVGSQHLELYGAHHNLSGRGDTLRFSYGVSEGADNYSAYYTLPVTAQDTGISLYYDKNNANIIEAPFDSIDIESNSETWGLRIRHPFYKTVNQEVALSLAVETRHSETFLLGEPFSFSPGVEDGECDVTVLRFSQEWSLRRFTQVFAARSVFSLGINAMGATSHDLDPDGQFFAWLGQFQWAKRLKVPEKSQVIFRTDIQLSADPLLPLEKFSMGGSNSVRGYRENELVRDNGVFSSLEFRMPVFRMPLSVIGNTREDGWVQLAPFIDWGWSGNTDTTTPDPETISSAGIGIRWDPSSALHAEIYWAKALREMNYPDYDLQNDGIHFLLTWRFP